jgi:hypothetical protein
LASFYQPAGLIRLFFLPVDGKGPFSLHLILYIPLSYHFFTTFKTIKIDLRGSYDLSWFLLGIIILIASLGQFLLSKKRIETG